MYLVVKLLGQLAIASRYDAERSDKSIDVALERLPDHLETSEVKQMLGWEIAALAEIHPH